jgi:hypothetical protein
MVAALVYLLCALTSVACAVMLVRRYRASRVRLLLWSSICFFGLALNNILLFVDLVLTTSDVNLLIVRTVPAVIGYGVLLWGFIWESA